MKSTKDYKNLTAAERKAEIITEIKRYHREHSKVPGSMDLGGAFHARARLFFKNCETAVREALGVEPGRRLWSDEDLLSLLRDLYKKNGRFPTSRDIEAVKVSLRSTLRKRFGSLTHALERALHTSPRVEILRALDKLTPDGCAEATTYEIVHEVRTLSKVEVGCHLDDARNAHLVSCRVFGKRTRAWSLTDKGREFLKSFGAR